MYDATSIFSTTKNSYEGTQLVRRDLVAHKISSLRAHTFQIPAHTTPIDLRDGKTFLLAETAARKKFAPHYHQTIETRDAEEVQKLDSMLATECILEQGYDVEILATEEQAKNNKKDLFQSLTGISKENKKVTGLQINVGNTIHYVLSKETKDADEARKKLGEEINRWYKKDIESLKVPKKNEFKVDRKKDEEITDFEAINCFHNGVSRVGKVLAGKTRVFQSSASLFQYSKNFNDVPGDLDTTTSQESFNDIVENGLPDTEGMRNVIAVNRDTKQTICSLDLSNGTRSIPEEKKQEVEQLRAAGKIKILFDIYDENDIGINVEVYPENKGNGMIQLVEDDEGKMTSFLEIFIKKPENKDFCTKIGIDPEKELFVNKNEDGIVTYRMTPEMLRHFYIINFIYEFANDRVDSDDRKIKYAQRMRNLQYYLGETGVHTEKIMEEIENTLTLYIFAAADDRDENGKVFATNEEKRQNGFNNLQGYLRDAIHRWYGSHLTEETRRESPTNNIKERIMSLDIENKELIEKIRSFPLKIKGEKIFVGSFFDEKKDPDTITDEIEKSYIIAAKDLLEKDDLKGYILGNEHNLTVYEKQKEILSRCIRRIQDEKGEAIDRKDLLYKNDRYHIGNGGNGKGDERDFTITFDKEPIKNILKGYLEERKEREEMEITPDENAVIHSFKETNERANAIKEECMIEFQDLFDRGLEPETEENKKRNTPRKIREDIFQKIQSGDTSPIKEFSQKKMATMLHINGPSLLERKGNEAKWEEEKKKSILLRIQAKEDELKKEKALDFPTFLTLRKIRKMYIDRVINFVVLKETKLIELGESKSIATVS